MMSMQKDVIHLIVIEETANDAEVILNILRKARYPIRPRHVEDDEDLRNALNDHQWDLIISVPKVGNPDVGEFVVTDACQMVSLSKQDIPVIVLIDTLDAKIVTDLLNGGASQVIPKGYDAWLQLAVGRELSSLEERRHSKHLEQLYKETQKHNKMLLETSRDAIAYVHDGMHIYANPSYLDMFGYKSMDDLGGLPIMDLVAINDQSKFKDFMREYMVADKVQQEDSQIDLEGLKSNNKRFKLKMEVSQAIYDSERCIQVVIRDQSQSQELEQKLKEASRRDVVTGLFNRQYFLTVLEKSLAIAMEKGTRSVLFYIMIDNVATLREKIGVGAMDPVVQNLGQVVSTLSEGGTLARFGDNVFTLLLSDKNVKDASDLAEKLCKALAETVTEVNRQSVLTTCSIGIALVLASAASPQDVLSDAHTACMEASKRGGNSYEVYKAVVKTDQGGLKTSEIAKMIETSIEENRLSLRYQPIVNLHGETQEIYEVFLRMVDVKGETVPTNMLFSSAEQAGLTIHLDKWVLKEAAKTLMKQHQEGHQTSFFIKLSDQAIRDENVILYIRKLLKSIQLSGDRFIFEISETSAINQIKLAKAFITTLKTMGCRSALEHFGTALNPKQTLSHLPVDYVKIDSSFSKGLSTNPENRKAIEDIVKMAHESKKLTIAEAVEDANSLTVLWQCEVDFAQGHYIQPPAEELDFDFSDD